MRLPGLPSDCESSTPSAWQWAEDRLSAQAGPRDNLFISPITRIPDLHCPLLLFPAEGDFLFSAKVEVNFTESFDAAALIVHREEAVWAKLCLEFSYERDPMVVSVVTRGTSDDANCDVQSRPWVYLRIARIGDGFAFHYAEAAGAPWKMVRQFTLDSTAPVRVGFLVQSPRGEGCRGVISEISFERAQLAELRSGA